MLDETTIVRADTVEKAIKLGLAKLGITEDQAHINVISEGKKGLFGFGKQDAIVELTVQTDRSILELADHVEQKLQDQAETVKVEEAPLKKAKAQESKKESPSLEVEPADPEVVETVEVETVKTVREAKPAPQADRPPAKESRPVTETAVDQDRQAAFEFLCQYLTDVIAVYGAEAEVTYRDEGRQVVFDIETDKSGLIIGRHGRIINSLQTLAQVLLFRQNIRRVAVILNIGNYRNRRKDVLEQIAERSAQEALKTRQTVILDPLPSYERKQIHHYLGRYRQLETHSEGKEPNRYLVIDYKG